MKIQISISQLVSLDIFKLVLLSNNSKYSSVFVVWAPFGMAFVYLFSLKLFEG